jgi:hypothetical protein
MRVAAVDQCVAQLEIREQLGADLIDERYRHHQPQDPRLLQFRDQVTQRSGTGRALWGERIDGLRRNVEDDTVVAALEQTAHHVGTHPSQTNHS